MTGDRDSYLIGTRPIDHDRCTRGASGVWYPDFGQGVEIFGWAHDHDRKPVEASPADDAAAREIVRRMLFDQLGASRVLDPSGDIDRAREAAAKTSTQLQLYAKGFEHAKNAALYVLSLYEGVPPEVVHTMRTLQPSMAPHVDGT